MLVIVEGMPSLAIVLAEAGEAVVLIYGIRALRRARAGAMRYRYMF